MLNRNALGALAVIAALYLSGAGARAFDDAQYPDFNGRWTRAPAPPGVKGQLLPPFDPTKPSGLGQETPVTPEYKALWEASLADQYAGGPGARGATCRGGGVPHAMNLYDPMDMIVLPETTYIVIDRYNVQRRIFTDGRDWPKDIDPSLNGYSIGRWLDPEGSGHFTVLEVETRGFTGPRVYDAMSAPLDSDNQSVIKERIYLDRADKNLLHDEITVIDHSLTRPWTVDKRARRDLNPRPVWVEDDCPESNVWIEIGKQTYYLSGDRELMPSKKGQAPPDLKYFKSGK